MKRPAVFLDRDNTLIVSDGFLGDPDGVVLVDGAAELVARVRRLGYAAVTFSNQSGVARGLFTEQDVHRVNSRLDEMLRDQDAGAVIDRHEFCPHHPEAAVPRYRQASEFRKPAPGMIYQAARQLGLDLGRSWVVGDAPRDIEAGRAAGCRTILFNDPALPPSSAAREPSLIQPDFVAASLREVADVIENNPPVEEPPETAPVAEVQPDETLETDGRAVETSREQTSDAEVLDPPAAAIKDLSFEPEQTSPTADPGLVAAELNEPGSSEESQPSVSPALAAISEEAAPGQAAPLQSENEQDMDDRPTPGESGSGESDGTARRRSPPAVILAAKAARAAARNSAPGASAEVLREVARNAARAAAMGITPDYAVAAPDQPPPEPGPIVVEPAAAPVAAPDAVSPYLSPPAPQQVEPATTPSPIAEVAEPAQPVQPAFAHEPEETRAGPIVNLNRLEDIAEQILMELRQRNDGSADFSVSKLMAGITMVLSLAILVYAYLYRETPSTLQNLLLLGLMLQSITISLMLMGRQK